MATRQEFKVKASAEAQKALGELLRQATDARIPGLQRLARLQARRSERLAGAGKRLSKSLGKDDPRAVALSGMAASADQLRTEASIVAKRESRKPRLKSNEWAAFGRVMDAKGKPVAGLRARIADKDHKPNDKLLGAETDEFGDFFLVLAVKSVFSDGTGSPEFHLQVTDKAGKELFFSEKPLDPQAGQAEYFEIILNNTKPTPRRKKGVTRRRG